MKYRQENPEYMEKIKDFGEKIYQGNSVEEQYEKILAKSRQQKQEQADTKDNNHIMIYEQEINFQKLVFDQGSVQVNSENERNFRENNGELEQINNFQENNGELEQVNEFENKTDEFLRQNQIEQQNILLNQRRKSAEIEYTKNDENDENNIDQMIEKTNQMIQEISQKEKTN